MLENGDLELLNSAPQQITIPSEIEVNLEEIDISFIEDANTPD